MATPPGFRYGRATDLARFSAFAICAASLTYLPSAVLAQVGGSVHYYSTAAPPPDYPGPVPVASPVPDEGDTAKIEPAPLPPKAVEPEPARVASTAPDRSMVKVPRPQPAPIASTAPDPIVEAIARITACEKTFTEIKDYTCVFYKRERIGGRLSPVNQMQMKARTTPHSIYFKFVSPNKGREAIYVAGSYGNKAVVHDVGIGKLIAGTLKLDPKGSMAMEDNRHPVTDAGIGHLIETIKTAWHKELSPTESKISFHPNAKVSGRSCMMIESMHPNKRPEFLFYMVKVYIDKEKNLPIRFEAYDWPKGGKAPELVEEYTYTDLKTNVGLNARDFDPNNSGYSFGRF